MKMKASRFYSNWYLILIAMASFVFLSQMAIAEPLCTNCSVNLVKWALPRAELLMGGWLIAVVNESWMARSMIASAYRKLPFVVRRARAIAESQKAAHSSASNETGTVAD